MSETNNEANQHPAFSWPITHTVQTKAVEHADELCRSDTGENIATLLDYFRTTHLSDDKVTMVVENLKAILHVKCDEMRPESIAVFIIVMAENYSLTQVGEQLAEIFNILCSSHLEFFRQDIHNSSSDNLAYLLLALLSDKGYVAKYPKLLSKLANDPDLLATLFLSACTRANLRLLRHLAEKYHETLNRSKDAYDLDSAIYYLKDDFPDNSQLEFIHSFNFIANNFFISCRNHQSILLGYIQLYLNYLSKNQLVTLLQNPLKNKYGNRPAAEKRFNLFYASLPFYRKIVNLNNTYRDSHDFLMEGITEIIGVQFDIAETGSISNSKYNYLIAMDMAKILFTPEMLSSRLIKQEETVLHLCWKHTKFSPANERQMLAFVEKGADPFITDLNGASAFTMSLNALAQSYDKVGTDTSAETRRHEARLAVIFKSPLLPSSGIAELCSKQQQRTLLSYLCKTRAQREAYPDQSLFVIHSTQLIRKVCEKMLKQDCTNAHFMGTFPLHHALHEAGSKQAFIKSNAIQLVKLLLSLEGINVNQPLPYGDDEKKPIELVKDQELAFLLMQNGAHIFDISPNPQLKQTIAEVDKWQRKICKAIASTPVRMDAIHTLLAEIVPESVIHDEQTVNKCHAYLNAPLAAGDTLLTYCIKWKATEVYELLISHGANDKIKNTEGKTAQDLLPEDFCVKSLAPKSLFGSNEVYG